MSYSSNEPDTLVSLMHVHRGKALRTVANMMTEAGCAISHNTVAALVSRERQPCATKHGPVLWQLGGMLPPGTDEDRARRAEALILTGYATGVVSPERILELVADALTLWPRALMSAELSPARRLNLGVTTLLLRNRAASGRLDAVLGPEFLTVHGLGSDCGRARARRETLALADTLVRGLDELPVERFLSGNPATSGAEINGVRYLRHALLENWFGAAYAIACALPLAKGRRIIAKAAVRVARAGYCEQAIEIDRATDGRACWKLGNAFQLAIYAGDHLRTLEAARHLAGRSPDFHREPYGRSPKAACLDPSVWIGLAVIRHLSHENDEALSSLRKWLGAPAYDSRHAPCLDAIRRLREHDGLPLRSAVSLEYTPNPAEFPRLMALIEPFISGDVK